MSLEEGIKGVSLLSKPQWKDQFKELIAMSFVEPWDKYEIEHREMDWENIPFVIPKSIVVLERKVTRIQQWAKIKHQEIEKLLTNEFFDQLRAEMKGEKQLELKWKDEIAKRFEGHQKNIRELFDLDMKRNELEAREISNEEFFDQFLGEMDRMYEKNEANEYQPDIKEGQKPDYEKLRKFSFRQLRYFFFKLLNRSDLVSHVGLIDHQIKKLEEKIETLVAKDNELERKIILEKNDLKKDLLPKFEDVYHHIDTAVMPKLNDFEEMISNIIQNIDEMKMESEENKAFRENLIHKVDDVTKRTHTFSTSFEAKLAKMNEDIKILKAKTDDRLNEFEEMFNSNVEKIINEFDQENAKQKDDFLERMQSFQRENKEFLEKFSTSITKNVNVMQFETKRSLEGYKEELTRNITQFNDTSRDMERKLQRFIEKFETYSKTKIEPAFQNQAKILLLESRVQEQEEFGSRSALFIREICAKLVQSLINYNSSNKKREENAEKKIKNELNHSFYITETPTININKENDSENQQIKVIDTQSQSKFSPYEGFGLRANLNMARFKNSKNRFVPITVEGNTVIQNVPPKSANPSEINPRDRFSSMDLRLTDAFHKNLNDTMTKFIKDKAKLFDPIFHKKLDIILRALNEEGRSFDMKKSDSLESKDPIKNFKDISLIRVTDRGVSRGRKSSLVNKTFSEFDDNHLL